VFVETIFKPIGGGRDFRWEGYDDAVGRDRRQRMQSVPGGTHWGARRVDQRARPGAHRAVDARTAARTTGGSSCRASGSRCMQQPNAVAPFYGLLTWLNRDGAHVRRRLARQLVHVRRGRQHRLDRPDHEAVIVSRWLDGAHSAEFVRRISRALAGVK
jgi:hypothetical protein